MKIAAFACWLLMAHAAALGAPAAAPTIPEQELRSRIVALVSTIRGGVTYQDYARQVQELTALFERHERSGAAPAELREIHRLLVDARQAWDRVVEMRNRRLSQPTGDADLLAAERAREKAEADVIQRSWRTAIRQLEGDPAAE